MRALGIKGFGMLLQKRKEVVVDEVEDSLWMHLSSSLW